jgi:hypothetical protein
MGGSTLPTASTPGYGTMTRNGRTYVGCDCVIAFVEAGEGLGLARGLIKYNVDIVQLTGTAAASAGTHAQGGAFDVRQYSREWSHLWREMGAAGWPRIGADWDGNEHFHGVIDCPHNAPAAYQIPAYWRGYSGLGQATSSTYAGMWGYGSKDPDPWRPSTRRTWREGIAWANAQTAAITAQEDDMAMTPAERAALIDDIATKVWNIEVPNHDANRDGKPDGASLTRSNLVMANWRGGQLQGAVATLAGQVAGLAKALEQISGGQVDIAEVQAAAKAGAQAALDERISDADVTLNVTPSA